MNPQKKRSPFVISFTMFAAAAAASALIAYGISGPSGLQGCALGVGVAAVMCGVSFGLMAWARHVRGNALLGAMLGGAIASLVILAVAMVIISSVARERLATAALTALAVYLAFRFAEAAFERRAPLGSQPLHGGPTA
jgi:hypothetical protein